MNVILNTDEAQAVLTLVSAQVLDHVELSGEAKEAIREWRRSIGVNAPELDEFTGALNLAIGNYIDERTTRMMRTRGQLKVKSSR